MFTLIGKTKIESIHQAKCHCEKVELALSLPNGVKNPRRCNCSMCRRKGTISATINVSSISVVRGVEFLKYYQFNSFAAKHYFCSNCGIHTHHQRRSNSQEYGFNVGCLSDVNPFDLGDVDTSDGINHIADRNEK